MSDFLTQFYAYGLVVAALVIIWLIGWCYLLQKDVDALRKRQTDHYETLSARIAHARRKKP